jgi:hypothetical protein
LAVVLARRGIKPLSLHSRNWLEEYRIPFVPRKDNPSNIPQARPIENVWALLSGRVYINGWEAQNEQQLRRRIMQKIREVDLVSVQNLMRNVKRKELKTMAH